jgi:hypothetical protein
MSGRDYHDVPFPEGTQPATGEWTVENISEICGFVNERERIAYSSFIGFLDKICTVHNAAIDAERTRSRTFSGKVIEFQQQLAAERDSHEITRDALASEREKVQTLVDALKEVNSLARGNMTGCGTCSHVIDATIKALAKVEGGEKK